MTCWKILPCWYTRSEVGVSGCHLGERRHGQRHRFHCVVTRDPCDEVEEAQVFKRDQRFYPVSRGSSIRPCIHVRPFHFVSVPILDWHTGAPLPPVQHFSPASSRPPQRFAKSSQIVESGTFGMGTRTGNVTDRGAEVCIFASNATFVRCEFNFFRSYRQRHKRSTDS